MQMFYTLEELAAALTDGDLAALRALLRAAGFELPDGEIVAVPRAVVIELMARHAGDAVARAAATLLRSDRTPRAP